MPGDLDRFADEPDRLFRTGRPVDVEDEPRKRRRDERCIEDFGHRHRDGLGTRIPGDVADQRVGLKPEGPKGRRYAVAGVIAGKEDGAAGAGVADPHGGTVPFRQQCCVELLSHTLPPLFENI